ncbi:MAG: PhoH family protein [Burkholderiales bacterium]|nr:PhoH family protein [Burkholderiales bacterium]
MPLPKAPQKRGSILKDLPEQLDSYEEMQETLKAKAAPKKSASKKQIKAAPKAAQATPVVEEAPVIETVPPLEKAPVKSMQDEERTLSDSQQTHTASSRKRRKAIHGKGAILYVLDTNVLLHDPSSLFRFKEHDVYLPMITLEELDNHKSGRTDEARNARQVSRSLDAVMQHLSNPIADGIPLNVLGNVDCLGRLYVQTTSFPDKLPMLPEGKADNQILAVVKGLKELKPDTTVILVSKDINMRLKAAALDLEAEDYFNDKILEDTDLLYSGERHLPEDFWSQHSNSLKSYQKDGATWYEVTGPLPAQFRVNEFVWLENDGMPFYGQVKSVENDTAVIKMIKDFSHQKNSVWGITARNREQSFALSLLTDPDIDFVTLLGPAGTGKTLLALAAALTQTLENRKFNEIIVTRATVSVGEDIGFLPGSEEEKMTPWLGAVDDNLEVLTQGTQNDWSRKTSETLIRSRIRIKSMSFMRGRTFLNKFVIIDEAQNLTPKQMKTLITRAGPGTKMVCLGNIGQIDTPYLTEGSSGLTYVVDRFKGWSHSGHITMQRGERSRLADFAATTL